MVSGRDSNPYRRMSSANCSGVALSGPPSAARSRKYCSKPAGRDDLKDPARFVTGIPEGVPLIARLEHQFPRTSLDDLVSQQRTHTPFEDEAVLILARVTVQRRGERPRGHRVLEEREPIARLRATDQKANPDTAEEDAIVVGRSHNFHACRLHGDLPSIEHALAARVLRERVTSGASASYSHCDEAPGIADRSRRGRIGSDRLRGESPRKHADDFGKRECCVRCRPCSRAHTDVMADSWDFPQDSRHGRQLSSSRTGDVPGDQGDMPYHDWRRRAWPRGRHVHRDLAGDVIQILRLDPRDTAPFLAVRTQ